MSGLFITGVGTGVGKTLVTTILCAQLRELGRSVSALKPVVSGFALDDPESDPALILKSLGRIPTLATIDAVSPWRFSAPLSPHLAARHDGRAITLEEVARFCRSQVGGPGSLRLIEGAGGVMSPICADATCLDLMALLGEPVVLVTGTYLGTISHTLTALSAIRASDLPVRGIVVSDSAAGVGLEETVEAIRDFGGAGTAIYPLPRLQGKPGDRWRLAPPLTDLCEGRDG